METAQCLKLQRHDVNPDMAMGVGRGRQEGPLWISKILTKKGCFLSFEWEKTNLTTFGRPYKTFGKIL